MGFIFILFFSCWTKRRRSPIYWNKRRQEHRGDYFGNFGVAVGPWKRYFIFPRLPPLFPSSTDPDPDVRVAPVTSVLYLGSSQQLRLIHFLSPFSLCFIGQIFPRFSLRFKWLSSLCFQSRNRLEKLKSKESIYSFFFQYYHFLSSTYILALRLSRFLRH